jgi:hypothetical protein
MKTNMKFTWLLLLLVFSGIAQANVDLTKTSDLLNFCNAVVHPDSMQDVQRKPIFRNGCVGYINGWLGGIEGVLVPDDKGILGTVTFEGGVTSLQVTKVFVLYMENHPEEENKPAHIVLWHAMLDSKLVTLVAPGKDTVK